MTNMIARLLHLPLPDGHAGSEQPPATTVRTRKTSVLPGPLRHFLDKITATQQIKAAARLNEAELEIMLNRQDIHGGRSIRAIQREPQRRVKLPDQEVRRKTSAAPKPSVEQTTAADIRPSASVLPHGPVIDPDTGALDKTCLRHTAHALCNAFPPLPDHLALTYPTSDRLRNRLIKEVRAISTFETNTIRLKPCEFGLAVRDAFDQASKTAEELAHFLEGRKRSGDDLHPHAVTYSIIAGLLTELKRKHLSAAALDIGNHYAERETGNLERVAPGISQGISGPNLTTNGAISLTYAPLHARGALTAQAGVSGGAVWFADDDRDIDYWTTYTASLKVSMGTVFQQLRQLTGKLTGQLSAEISYSGGDIYFEHDDLRELVKLIANLDANRSQIHSANPKIRALISSMEKFRNDVARLFGRTYMPAEGHPYYLNDEKIEKGANAFKITLMSTELDEHLGDDRFSKLIAAAYPPVGDVLRQRIARQASLPAATRSDVPDSVSYADRRVAFREATAIVDANLGIAAGRTDLEAKSNFDMSFKGDLMQFFVETAKAPHQLLNPDYHKDFKATLELHRQLDECCGSSSTPQLYLYDMMRRRLQAPPRSWSGRDELLYGDAASVPAQFRRVVERPAREQLAHAAEQAQFLTDLYLRFIDDGTALLAMEDKFTPQPIRAGLQSARVAAFTRLNDEVWGGRYAQAKKKMLDCPMEFVTGSYAGISLALGCIGTHIALAKQQIAKRGSPRDTGAIVHADACYDTARQLLDQVYLPLKKYDVQKDGPLKDTAIWERWDAALKLQASSGAETNLMDLLLNGWKKSLGPVSITNDAGNVTASVEVKFLKATRQINPCRLGTFWQITFAVQTGGAPLVGSMLDQLVHQAIKKLNANLMADAPKIDLEQTLRQLQGLALNVSDGSSIVMKFRQAPGLTSRSTDLQYIRVLSNKSGGLGVSVALPTHAGTLTSALAFTDSFQGFQGEIIGPDLGYLMLQHPNLAKLLAQAPGNNPDELQRLFHEHPRVRDVYFGRRQTIVEVVQRYADYLDAKNEATARGRSLESTPMINEFQRYYASQPFARTARIAREMESYAPGSTAHGDGMPRDPLPLSTDIEIGDLDLDAASEHLQTLETIDQRVTYFCGAGRDLLDAFNTIVGNTREINLAAFRHVDPRNSGIQTSLRDAPTLRRYGT